VKTLGVNAQHSNQRRINKNQTMRATQYNTEGKSKDASILSNQSERDVISGVTSMGHNRNNAGSIISFSYEDKNVQ
jgi:hypothetical protein